MIKYARAGLQVFVRHHRCNHMVKNFTCFRPFGIIFPDGLINEDLYAGWQTFTNEKTGNCRDSVEVAFRPAFLVLYGAFYN